MTHVDGCYMVTHVDGCYKVTHVDGCYKVTHVDGCYKVTHVDGCYKVTHVDGCYMEYLQSEATTCLIVYTNCGIPCNLGGRSDEMRVDWGPRTLQSMLSVISIAKGYVCYFNYSLF